MKHPLWRIELFGGLRALAIDPVETREAAGPTVSRFRTQKVGALLAYLSFYKNRRHPREVLIDLLWPGSSPQAGRASLSVALSSLRHQFEPPGRGSAGTILLADRFSLGLRPGAITTDVAEFEGALARADGVGGALLSRDDRIATLMQAVGLYRGPLLPGIYDAWIAAEQERLAGLFFDAADRLAGLLMEEGDLSRALACARRLVAQDPLREEAHQRLIQLLLRSGQPGAALRQGRDLEHLLRNEMSDAPSARTRLLIREAERHLGRATGSASDEDMATAHKNPPPPVPPDIPDVALGRREVFPTGTVTFLLASGLSGTDVDKERAARLRDVIRRHGGRVLRRTTAGAFLAAFAAGGDALASAVAAAKVAPLALRVALHTGDVEYEKGTYGGTTLQQASCILDTLHPGQVVCSEVTVSVVHELSGVRIVDLGVYRLPAVPGPALRLFQVNDEGQGDEPAPPFPPLQAAGAGENISDNLPVPLTRFFGRQTELARLRSLFASPETRLVTITGPGGTGKTRLALEVARQQSEAPPTRTIWFAPLVDLTNSAQIPDALRDTLRLPAGADVDSLEQVISTLSRQPRPLLVLDNFEHLVDERVSILEALLRRVPGLTCLVTSRRRLDLSFEREFVLSPLPTPPGCQEESPERLIRNASVQLFVDRAQGVKPDFQVTWRNAEALARLCRRLEGIPLALELAAGRALLLPPAQMLAQIDSFERDGAIATRRFEILTSRKRDLPSRHRTLRAAIDWSYHLLTPEMQRVFAALSVFRGSWTVEAAEAVTGDLAASCAIMECLADLRGCSLLQEEEMADSAGNDATRFRLLETLQEYAAEQLTPEERAERERRHALYYLSLAESAAEAFTARQKDQFQRWPDADRENLHAALDWAVRAQEAQIGLRLGGALWWFWTMRGHVAEGRERLTNVLALDDRAPEQTPDRATSRARAEACAGLLALAQRDHAAARCYLEAAARTWRVHNDQASVASTLNSLGSAAQAQGDLAAARAFFEESLLLWRENDGPRGAAIALNNLASVLLSQGDLMRAEAACAEAGEICREHGYRGTQAWSLYIQGTLAEARGDLVAAQVLHEEGLHLRRTAGAKPGIAESLFSLGRLAHVSGDFAAARSLCSESLALRREMNDQGGIAACLEELTRLTSAHRTKRHIPSNLPLPPAT